MGMFTLWSFIKLLTSSLYAFYGMLYLKSFSTKMPVKNGRQEEINLSLV